MTGYVMKRAVCLVCAVLLMFSVFSACGEKSEPKTDNSAVKTDANTEAKTDSLPVVELTLSQFSTDIDKRNGKSLNRIEL